MPSLDFVDTHCHLSLSPLSHSIPQVVADAKAQGVHTLINIGIDNESNQVCLNTAQQFKNVYAVVGYHPCDLPSQDTWKERLEQDISQYTNIVAIGEIGLDFFKGPQDQKRQIRFFETQIELADVSNLPVVVHARQSIGTVLSVLDGFVPSKKGVLHSFAGTYLQAKRAIELGFFIGVNGIVTFPNAQQLRELVSKLPLDCLLLETDSPFLAPQPVRGKTNEPQYIPMVANKIAEIKGITVREVARQTTDNARHLFGVPL